MFENQSPISTGLGQFILGFGASFGLCLYLGRAILARHDERHTTTEKIVELLREDNAHLRDRITALESAHNERGAGCAKKLTPAKRTRKD